MKNSCGSANGISNDVSVIDVDNLKVVKPIATGRYPWAWRSSHERTPALRIAGLSHRYGARLALDGVSLNVAPGGFALAALLGPTAPARARCTACLPGCWPARAGRLSCLASPCPPGHGRAGRGVSAADAGSGSHRRANLAYFAALHGLRGSERRARIDAELQRMALASAGTSGCAFNKRPPPPGGNRPRPAAPPASVAAGRSHRRPGHAGAAVLVEHKCTGWRREEGLAVLWATHLIDEVRADDHIALLHQAGCWPAAWPAN